MVDQAQVNGPSVRAEAPPRAVARSTGELLEDLLTLAELQGRLLALDVRQGLWRLAIPVACLAGGACVTLGTAPIALTAMALCLEQTTSLTLAQSFGLSLLAGMVVAAALLAGGWKCLRQRLDILERSRTEWRQNAQWVRSALKRFGGPAQRHEFPPSFPR